jgi:hypothetical protein
MFYNCQEIDKTGLTLGFVLGLSLYAFLFLVFMLSVVLLVPAGVDIERRPRRADARGWSSSRGDDGDEPQAEWDSVVNRDW